MNFNVENGQNAVPSRPRRPKSKYRTVIIIATAIAVFAVLVTLSVFLFLPEIAEDTDSGATIDYVSDGKLVIYVDAGHGYIDPGADSEYLGDLSEKDINLSVALRLADYLRSYGAEVKMTRTSDIPPEGEDPEAYKLTPQMRAEIVNGDADADVFVSVHCDSFPSNPDVRGLRVHYDKNNTKDTPKLAKKIAASATDRLDFYGMPEAKLISYGSTSAGIYVLRNITVPSVLVELGFLTNTSDAYLMQDERWADDAAHAIADGMAEFFGLSQAS